VEDDNLAEGFIDEDSMHPGTVWLSKKMDKMVRREIKKKKIAAPQADNRRIGKRKRIKTIKKLEG